MKRTLPIQLLMCAALCSCQSGPPLDIAGKWMITHGSPIAGAKGNEETIPPGACEVDIAAGSITTTTYMLPGYPPFTNTDSYTVQSQGADSLTIVVVHASAKRAPTTTVYAKTATGLQATDDRMVWTLVPLDPAAVASVKKQNDDAMLPADPLKDQPLAGLIDGTAWTPVAARPSTFHLDEDKGHIPIEVTTGNSPAEAGKLPRLYLPLPTTVGDYPLSNDFTLIVMGAAVQTTTATGSSSSMRSTPIINGTLSVTKVTATAIDFALTAKGQHGIVINGHMTADITP